MERMTFRVYFTEADQSSNQKLFDAEDMLKLIEYLVNQLEFDASSIYKIEIVE